jgi:hypothetical protein
VPAAGTASGGRPPKQRRDRLSAPAAALAALALCSGCASRVDATSTDTIPSEGHTREAYLDTPVVTDARVRAVPAGATRREVTARLGRAHVVYPRDGLTCVLYPILGTQRRDRFGSPFADEWELCFDEAGGLAARTRVRNEERGPT